MDGIVHKHSFDYRHDPNWRIFRIMAEFIDGFDFLANFQKSVSVFGSARTDSQDPYYFHARELCSRIGAAGFAVITGGGPGIMEAANEGAKVAGVDSIGLNIDLSANQKINPYVTQSIDFEYFFTRKVMLSFSSQVYIYFPGGFGTLDELFEMVTLIQTNKIEDHIPIVLVGTEYWQPLYHWLEQTVCQRHGHIKPEELKLLTITDDLDQIVEIVRTSQPRTHR